MDVHEQLVKNLTELAKLRSTGVTIALKSLVNRFLENDYFDYVDPNFSK